MAGLRGALANSVENGRDKQQKLAAETRRERVEGLKGKGNIYHLSTPLVWTSFGGRCV